jgi:large subunit ribosomal protein L23
MNRIIRHPLITEKTSNLQSQGNQYVFLVDPKANKLQIKKEVMALKPGIEIEDVRTLIVRGKVKRLGRSMGKRTNFKKAIVRLKAGQTLELFEQV